MENDTPNDQKELDRLAQAMGTVLKQLRQEHRMSQSDVYLKANLDRTTYQRYDTGKRTLPMINLIKIAEALGTTPGDIVDRAYTLYKKSST